MSHVSSAQIGRPHWGLRQVRSLSGLKVGQICKIKHSHLEGNDHNIIVLSEPFQNSKGQWTYEYTYWPLKGDFNLILTAFCDDKGIVPYDDGKWNRTNSIHRTGRLRLSGRKLAKIRSKLTKVD